MILELTKHDIVWRVKEASDDQSSTEMAEIFFRLLLAVGYHIETVMDAYEAVVDEHSWVRGDDEH